MTRRGISVGGVRTIAPGAGADPVRMRTIRNLSGLSAKVESIDNYLITNRKEGMISFDGSIRRLLNAGKITRG